MSVCFSNILYALRTFLSSAVNGGECDSLNQLDVEQCVEAIKNNPDLVVGVKVRITASVADDGRNEQESYR